MPAQWGSSSVISSARRRRRPGTALARPRRSSSSRRAELALVQRDDDLAAALDGDAALLAVVVQARGALDAQPRLQRPGLVVDAGVDDAGVVAGLAGAHLVGGVDDGHAQRRTAREQLARAGQADDARPDDGEVVALHDAARVVVASGATAVAWSVVQVLVTGASGAIGAELVPRLARGGHAVRAFARDPSRVTAPGVAEVVRGDAVTGRRARRGARRRRRRLLPHPLDGDGAQRRRHASPTATARPRSASPRRRAPRACGASSTSAASCPPTRPPRRTWPAASRSRRRCSPPRPRRSRCAPRSSSRPARARSASSCASSSACRSCRCRPGASIARGPSTGAT